MEKMILQTPEQFFRIQRTLAWVISEKLRLKMPLNNIWLYAFPRIVCFLENQLHDSPFANTDRRNSGLLKYLHFITTGVLRHYIFKTKLTIYQWFAFIILFMECTVTQISSSPNALKEYSVHGLVAAIVMALLSSSAGVCMKAIIKNHSSKNINVHNFWFSLFELIFNIFAIFDTSIVQFMCFFHGYPFTKACFILICVFCGIVASGVMKHADNIVRVYSTSIGMFLADFILMFFGFDPPYNIYIVFPLMMSFKEVWIYTFPAILYYVKNQLHDCLFGLKDGCNSQILKYLHFITNGVLCQYVLKRKRNFFHRFLFITVFMIRRHALCGGIFVSSMVMKYVDKGPPVLG